MRSAVEILEEYLLQVKADMEDNSPQFLSCSNLVARARMGGSGSSSLLSRS